MEIILPYTIENTTGEKLTFLRITIKNGIEYLEGENEVQPNAGPPMHVHYKQDECMTVIAGKMGYQLLGEEKKYAGPGETILFKAGIPHKFWKSLSLLLHLVVNITYDPKFYKRRFIYRYMYTILQHTPVVIS